MMYSNKFVLSVLVNGKPQQELANGVVPINFDTEYAVRLRNKHDRRAVAQIFIDGENVSRNGYVIAAHGFIDIERHFEVDRAFKFVSLDSPDAVEHGKNGPNDGTKGVVEARFFLEKPPSAPVYAVPYPYIPMIPQPYQPWTPWISPITVGDIPSSISVTWTGLPSVIHCCGGGTTSNLGASLPQNPGCVVPTGTTSTYNASMPVTNQLQDGCTTEGGETHQNFSETYLNLESNFTTLKVVLKGITEECRPLIPCPPASVLYCGHCGRKKPHQKDRFCAACGHKFA